MELEKIAQNEEMTYLEKVAAIVDEFAAGNVDGETADAVASEAGISPEDLLSVYNAAYGEAEMEKTASAEENEAGEMTYLQKVAAVVDGYVAGEYSDEDVQAIAEEHNLASEDLDAIYAAAYESGDIEKTAADEAVAELVKIAEAENSTYLEKCASIADTFAAGAISGEEADQLAVELGVEPSDVLGVFNAAYGDELGKEAADKASILDKIKKGFVNAATGKQFREGTAQVKKGEGKLKTFEQAKGMGERSKNQSKKFGDIAGKAKAEGEKLISEGKSNRLKGRAKTGALYGGAAALIGANKASKGDSK
jgi:hypothetical protein